MEDVDPVYNTVENDQKNGYGIRGYVRIIKEMDKMNIVVEPFIHRWDIDDSASSTVTCGGIPCAEGYEPKNETNDYGIRVGVEF